MKFFFDHNMSPTWAHVLAILYPDDQFVVLRDKFPMNSKDEVWLSELAKEGGWTVLTQDLGIKKIEAYRRIWSSADMGVLLFKRQWIQLSHNLQVSKLVAAWPGLSKAAAGGGAFTVTVNGKPQRV